MSYSYSNVRRDIIYIRVTINKKRFNYDLLKRRPKSMLPNQFCVDLPFEINEDEWFNRIISIGTIRPVPPQPRVTQVDTWVDKDTPDKVLDKIAGRE